MTEQALETRDLIGAVVEVDGTRFRLWAPGADGVDIILFRGDTRKSHELEPEGEGWFTAHVPGAGPGDRYLLRLAGGAVVPDPYSRFQPDGVHGASQIVDLTAFRWSDSEWRGRPLDELVIYELHVGTATPHGTFDALIDRLPHFVELGVTALEIMPVAEFPGERNWGYDGVFLFAPARAYGGPDAMRRFIDAAHAHGLAVILDVVYNHIGPEGNYLYPVTGGRIFTEKHRTPWGAAVNYDDDGSAAVRSIVLGNVRQWVRDYHVDGLRLDATHAIVDHSATHILQEIADEAHSADRPVCVIAEDERNERHLLLPPSQDGYGIDAVWADDVHHIIRRLTAGDREGYYSAYDGTIAELVRALRHGWLYEGEYYAPAGEARGTSAHDLAPHSFVHCIQNHDQVGNRALGERLNHQIELPAYRAVSALLLLAPATPLLWMGQEWAATTPFLYFTDHPEPLGRRVTQGRREEFSSFAEFSDAKLRGMIPDPQATATFERSSLRWQEIGRQPHAGVLALYRELLALRRQHPALQVHGPDAFDVRALPDSALALHRSDGSGHSGAELLLVVNLKGELSVDLPAAGGRAANDRGADRSAIDRSAIDRSAIDRSAIDRSDNGRSDTVRNDTGRSDTVRSENDRRGSDRSSRAASSPTWRVVLWTEEERFGGAGSAARLDSGTSDGAFAPRLTLPGPGALVLEA
jgi:maltooligosyltrehalose trehalohydrolase